MRRFYTVKMLCELFDKHENTIYEWINKDRLFPNAFKVKDGYYVPESDVERLMRQGRILASEKKAANPHQKPAGEDFVRRWRT